MEILSAPGDVCLFPSTASGIVMRLEAACSKLPITFLQNELCGRFADFRDFHSLSPSAPFSKDHMRSGVIPSGYV